SRAYSGRETVRIPYDGCRFLRANEHCASLVDDANIRIDVYLVTPPIYIQSVVPRLVINSKPF
ncbi:MAG TPA: hypothetical protein VLR47_12660, partial [Rhodospirillales bacterium]|nr:hypothetical protein [Rhodospirillales bacterium]